MDSKERKMDCWRYEYPDGAGPWFYPDGTPRNLQVVPSYYFGEGLLYGCDTVANLDKYMARYNIDTSNMILRCYYDVKVINYTPESGQIVFEPNNKF